MTRHLFHFSFLVLVAASFLLVSCSSKERELNEPNFVPTAGKTYQPKQVERVNSIELSSTYFDYDKWALLPHARKVLRQHAEWLRKNPTADIQVEGHCDERGSYQYNLVLGEKRAQAAKRYLEKLGIDGNRIQAVSRGRVEGGEPTRMAKNRKAAFIVFYRE